MTLSVLTSPCTTPPHSCSHFSFASNALNMASRTAPSTSLFQTCRPCFFLSLRCLMHLDMVICIIGMASAVHSLSFFLLLLSLAAAAVVV